MSLMKRIVPAASLFLLAAPMAGCGDDDGSTNPPDARPIDASVIDAGIDATPCRGHACSDVESPFDLPEHGEFRLEQFQTGPSGTGDDDTLAAQAFFFSNQTPASRPVDGDEITIREALAMQGYSCQDFRVGNLFDNGKSAEAQAVADSRTYIDVGANVTLTTVGDDGNDVVITLNKFLRADDPDKATDFSASLQHEILYGGEDASEIDVRLNATYKPAIAGSTAYPELQLGFGRSVLGDSKADANGDGDPLLYMPSDFQLTSPTEEVFFGESGLTFTRGEDFTFTYTIDNEEDVSAAGYPTIIPFVGFINEEGRVDAYCFKVTPGERDNGEFIVPHEVFEIIPEDPASGTLAAVMFGRFTHMAWEALNTPEASRLDLLGVACLLSPTWVVEDAR